MSLPNFEEPDYEQAVKICRDLGRISVSAIQRHLRMGYVKACLIVEAMGERGIAERVDPDGAWVFTANPSHHAEPRFGGDSVDGVVGRPESKEE